MRIERLILGRVDGGRPVAHTYTIEPGLSVIVVDEPERVAAAVRDTLTRPERDGAIVPFVSVEIQHGDIGLTVADDAAGGVRMMTRGRAGAIPEVLEIHTSDPEEVIDGGLDAIFAAVAASADAEDIEDVAPALAVVSSDAVVNDLSPEARRFLEATRRASELAAAVRQVDDRMTASVVPDWLWIATGVGGLGVFCTAIAFLYPELRVVLVATLVVLSVIGFSLYGWRAAQEMKTRARLQDERAKLRARREDARAEAKTARDALAATGQDPDALLVGLGDLGRSVPAIIALPGSPAPAKPGASPGGPAPAEPDASPLRSAAPTCALRLPGGPEPDASPLRSAHADVRAPLALDLGALRASGRQVLVFVAVAPTDGTPVIAPEEAHSAALG